MPHSHALTLYHNPNCSTSRQALALAKASGRSVAVVEYLKAGWTLPQLQRLSAAVGGAAALLRRREPGAADLAGAPDAEILRAMMSNPKLVERPILEGPGGAVIGRPIDLLAAALTTL